MPTTITKAGNVVTIDLSGISYTLPTEATITRERNATAFVIYAKNGVSVRIEYGDVTSPVAGSVDALINLLSTDYFNTPQSSELTYSGAPVSPTNRLPTEAVIEGEAKDGSLNRVSVTRTGELAVDIQRDIFGNLSIADQFTIWDSTRIFGYMIPLFWSDLLIGAGASNTHVKANSKNVLRVQAVGEIAATQTKQRHKYQPLKAHKIALTGQFPQQVGIEKIFGLADLDDWNEPAVNGTIYNGVVCRVTENSVYVEIHNNGVRTEQAEQAAWNIDKLDGTGPSGITLDLESTQIFIGEMEWLGVGAVKLYMNIAGQNVPIHIFEHANNGFADVYMRTANLPVMYMIRCVSTPTVAGEMHIVCNAVVSGGGHNPAFVPRSIFNNAGLNVASGIEEALLFMRLKTEAYEAQVEVSGFTALVENAGNTLFSMLFNPTWIGGALTWVDVPNSHVQYARAVGNNVITDEGIRMDSYTVSSKSDGIQAAINSKLRIGKNLQVNANQEGRYDIIVLTANVIGPGSEVYRATINYKDIS